MANENWKQNLPQGADSKRAEELLQATPLGRKALNPEPKTEKPAAEQTPVERWKGKGW